MVEELRARIAQMLGYFLDHLVGRKSKDLKVRGGHRWGDLKVRGGRRGGKLKDGRGRGGGGADAGLLSRPSFRTQEQRPKG